MVTEEVRVTISGQGMHWKVLCQCGHKDTASGMLDAQFKAIEHRKSHNDRPEI